MNDYTTAGDIPPEARPDLVVGLGGSAGAFSSLLTFFRTVAPDTGAAYVVILHLAPEYESRAAQVLQGATRMPVSQVRATMPLAANHVYVIAPGGTLLVGGHRLVPNSSAPPEQRRAPVDVFFRSLADAQGARAVAVVLSGTGANGSSGIKRVKEHGGLVLAQDPDEAEHAEMPRNAIATDLVDAVLPAAQLPDRIDAWTRHVAAAEPPGVRQDDDAGALRDVLAVLRLRTGQDFSNYKSGTVLRRVERRMNVRGLPSVSAYARLLRDQAEEPAALMRDLLISVTSFFRDREAFAVLAQRVLPGLFQRRTAMDQVRVWVAGCATGEEAYSMAMLLDEHAATSSDPPALLVLATDLDERAIARAREGYYTEGDVSDVSEQRLHRFFQRQGAGYRVRRDLREMVLFAHHNLIKDPPFSHLDLVTCRNVLIYLNGRVQDRLLETFHFALRPGGFLLLGTSETPDRHSELFVPVDESAHLYESRAVTNRPSFAMPMPSLTVAPRAVVAGLEARAAERPLPLELHQRLLEQYAPPSIVVTEDHDVLHVSGRAGRYLRVSGGELSRDLLRLVHPDLRVQLRTALHQAARERQPVSVPAVRVHEPTGDVRVSVTVRPVMGEGDPARGCFLVLFEDTAAPMTRGDTVAVDAPPQVLAEPLEEELARVRSELRSTVQQYETQVEEARASNEELQAMNEELRASTEELETSREELQSVNEELTTVNQELKIKIEELGLSNNDVRNLMNSTDIGTIFLDRALRVKLTTPRAQDVFNLRPGDIGRPLSDITSRLVHEGLHEDVRTVLDRLQTVEREVETRDGRWLLMRVLPYRTTDDRIDGIVMTFQDITGRMHAEQQVRASEERLRLLIDGAVDYAIFTMTPEGHIDSWNAGAERLFGYTAEEIVGSSAATLFTPEDREASAFDEERRAVIDQGRVESARWHVRKNGTRLFCSGVTSRLGRGGAAGLAKICRDLTGEREWALSLQQAHAELEDRVRRRTVELEREVRQHAAAEERVSHLLRRVVTTQEDERKRIARDLHDELGQRLTALRLALQRHAAAVAGAGAGIGEDLNRAQQLAAAVDAELDYISWELRPSTLDDLGLAAALPQYVAEWSAHYRVATECRTDGYTGTPLLPPDSEVAFYRVAQEALNNVAKHARASRVDVLLDRRDADIVLVIEDDGVGFETSDPPNSGFGLVSMRERAMLIGADLEIESKSGAGTTVFLRRRHDAAAASEDTRQGRADDAPRPPTATAGIPRSSP